MLIKQQDKPPLHKISMPMDTLNAVSALFDCQKVVIILKPAVKEMFVFTMCLVFSSLLSSFHLRLMSHLVSL